MAEYDHDFLVWFAGFFDGEGHIQNRLSGKNRRCIRLSARQSKGNNGEDVCKEIQSHFNGSIYFLPSKMRIDGLIRQDAWEWSLSDRFYIKELLTELMPYFKVKKSQAEAALRLMKENEVHYHPFREHEIEFIKNNYLSMEYKEIAKHLNRGVKAIRNFIPTLGLPYKMNLQDKRNRSQTI